MKKTTGTFKKGIVAAAALCLLSTASLAAVTPKTSITLTGGVLTVGDVFDGVDENVADHTLAPAPAHGKTMTLSSQDLQRISNAFNLGWFPTGASRPVTVRRDSREIDRYQIQAALQEQLAANMQGRRFDIELNTDTGGFYVPSGVPATLEVKEIKYDISKNDFRALVTAPAGAETPTIKREVAGRVYPLTSIPVLSRAMRAGDVISADNVQYVDMRAGDVSSSMIVSAEKLIGQTPRRGIAAMKPVAMSEVTQPTAVKKGDAVTMTLQSGALQLTAQGRALQDGGTGDVVRIINTSSNKVVEAVVTGDRTVSVAAPSAALDSGRVAGNF